MWSYQEITVEILTKSYSGSLDQEADVISHKLGPGICSSSVVHNRDLDSFNRMHLILLMMRS